MSLTPAFEIGIWNAWIFMLCDVLTIPFYVRIARSREASRETSELAGTSKTEKIILFSSKAIYIPALIYSIFCRLN